MENFGRGRGSFGGGRGRGRQNRAFFGQARGRGRTVQYHPVQPRNTEVASDALVSGMQSTNISQRSPPSSSAENGKRIPARRPDNGGSAGIRSVRLLANHFIVKFDPKLTIFHYNIDVKPEEPPKYGGSVRLPKSDMRLVKEKLFADDPTRFPNLMTAYDGEKNIFSAVELPTGTFKVEVSQGEDLGTRSYIFTISLVNKLELSKLIDYFHGRLPLIPRDILQGMDVTLKEIASRHYILKGRNMYSRVFNREDNLGYGIIASKGFQHSLKPTSQGLVLCVDYSVLPFRKAVPVLDFLKEHVPEYYGRPFDQEVRNGINSALRGIRVTMTHRRTNQKYTIKRLTDLLTKDLMFTMEDPEGVNPRREVSIVDYYREKYNIELQFKNIPCLDLSKNNKSNYVPMECCVLVEGQRYPKDVLDKDRDMSQIYKQIALAQPRRRMANILSMVRSEDGPRGGEVAHNFGISVGTEMTEVTSRILGPPDLRLGNKGKPCKYTINNPDCQWNLLDRSLVEAKQIDRWAILDCSSFDRKDKLYPDPFVHKLINRYANLGIYMKKPLFCVPSKMDVLSKADQLRHLLKTICDRAVEESGDQLQILFCVMTRNDPGYKTLKWICETEIGLVTQCCLSKNLNRANDQYLANLALKVNAKLGGSNFELFDSLPCLDEKSHVMFIGADVNHPGALNASSPSVAAVVATVNWPAANQYASRIRLQNHRTGMIKDFGKICLELVNIYAQKNKARPEKIVVFRDGVSESQFDMVLNEELTDLKNTFESDGYSPSITLVVAQKRHQTRLFPRDERQGGRYGNVSPGTVVDTNIVYPWGFDFYLCSHNGIIGTSKPTHYHVLWDENQFTSDELQTIINNLCYTFPRCTKPISLVPPAYYADLVAYRGQLYYDALLESHSSGSYSASSSSSFAYTLSPSDMRFVELHGNLENFMVFM